MCGAVVIYEHRDVPNTSDDKMDVDEEGEEEEQDGDKTVQAIVPEPDEGDRVTEPDEEDSATEPASEPEEPSSDFEQSIPLMEVVYGAKAKKATKTKCKGRAVEPEPVSGTCLVLNWKLTGCRDRHRRSRRGRASSALCRLLPASHVASDSG